MWKQVCEAWYSVATNVLETLYNSMPRRIADIIKQKNVQRNTDLTMSMYKFVYVFSFIGMHLQYVAVFSLECILYLYIYKCCLMISRNKMA